MSLSKIHNIYPTGFTTRHDVGLAWNAIGGLIYLVWLDYDRDKDTDGKLLFASSPYRVDHEPEWSTPSTVADDAKTGAGVAALDSLGAVAAYGDLEGKIRTVWMKDEWERGVLDDETTDDRPSLAFFDQRLYLAWTGTDDPGQLNTMYSVDKLNFEPRTLATYPETSNDSPGLAGDGAHLGIAWSGTDDRRSFNRAHVGNGILTDVLTIDERNGCNSGPSLTAREGFFYTAWGSTANQQIETGADIFRGPSYFLNAEQTQHAPGLAYPFIAWVDGSYTIQFGRFD